MITGLIVFTVLLARSSNAQHAGVELRDLEQHANVPLLPRAIVASATPQGSCASLSDTTGGVVTVERLLVTLAGATDQFVFQITGYQNTTALVSKQYSHTVELTETDAAGAVADLRARCAGFERIA